MEAGISSLTSTSLSHSRHYGMFELTPELQAKFAKFRDAYEWALVWLADAGGNAERKERNAFESACRDVPLSEPEEELFRRLLKEEAAEPKPVIAPHSAAPIEPPEDAPDELFSDPPPIPKPE